MKSYAIRQLNPFNGVLQVVETDAARAFSENGGLWQLQVLAERPEHTWRSADRGVQRQFFNWALWSREKGLHRVNANPLMDLGDMHRAGEELLAAIRDKVGKLPFPQADRFEYWNCDDRGHPIALIASDLRAEHTADPPDTTWHATPATRDDFQSPSLLAAGIPAQDARSAHAHTQRLEHEVGQHSASGLWVERLDDGGSRRLDNGEPLHAPFPTLGIETRWPDPLLTQLVRDYIEWLAPLLLLLPLAPPKRRQLEKQALRRASLVADRYLLYPEILQPEIIQEARVKARLRRTL